MRKVFFEIVLPAAALTFVAGAAIALCLGLGWLGLKSYEYFVPRYVAVDAKGLQGKRLVRRVLPQRPSDIAFWKVAE